MYLKINGEDTHYDVTIMPFTSQHGKKAVKFIGDEIPSTNKGFTYYNDDDTVLSDLSDFVYEYAPNEYTAEEDIVEYPKGSDAPLPTSAIARLNSKVNRLSVEVNDLTPYTETKTAYYGEKEKTFYNVPNGNTSVFFDKYNGGYSLNRVGDILIVSFNETIIEATNVTIMVQ